MSGMLAPACLKPYIARLVKRTLLPLNALRVYDAAARHLSFTSAADELAVTPAAVGQQIRALEDVLGTVLFRRTSKGLELTIEGRAGLDLLREGFLRIEESVEAMQAGQASDHYTLAVPREFYAQWFSHRLAAFRAAHPDVHIQIIDDEHADFAEVNLDLAVRLVDGAGELEGMQLTPARQIVVAVSGAPEEWIEYPGQAAPEGGKAAIRMGNPGQALSSVMAGMGRSTLPLALVEKALEEGTLEALGEPQPCKRAYWCLAPLPQWRVKKVRTLVAYLADA